jgi:hypothetical protein
MANIAIKFAMKTSATTRKSMVKSADYMAIYWQ